MAWLGAAGHLLYVWPLTAIPLALALGDWRNPTDRYLQLAAAAAGEFLAFELLHLPHWIGLTSSVVQMIEVFAVGSILSRTVTRFDDFKQRSNVLRLCFASLAVPTVAVIVGAIPGAALTHHSLLSTWLVVMPSDALGLMVVLPALLFCLSGEYRSLSKLAPHLRFVAPASALFLAVSVAIFVQTSHPFLFLVFPPLILLVFASGLEGAVFALPSLTVIACIATAYGHGPIWLRTAASQQDRTFTLQIFLFTVSIVALSVGALLDERRKAGRAAEQAQSIYQTLIQNAEDMIILSSLDGKRRFVSPAVQQILGWTPEEFVILDPLTSIHPADRDLARTVNDSLSKGKLNHSFRYRFLCKDGEFRWLEAFVRGFYDFQSGDMASSVTGYVATVRDISAQIESQDSLLAEKAVLAQEIQQLSHMALRDELTGIPNRRAFNLTLGHELSRHKRSDQSLSLLMIDVDHFKKYNDFYGHQAGDECLVRLARAISSNIGRVSDLAARLGGEEFVVLLPGTDEPGARRVAENILNSVRNLHIEHAQSPLRFVSVSVGISVWPPRFACEPALLVQQADRALYESKHLGRNRISICSDASCAAPTLDPIVAGTA